MVDAESKDGLSSNERFVTDLYRGVLKREPDPDGLRDHSERLGSEPSFDDAAALLSDFVNSGENSKLTVFRNLHSRVGAFKHIASIGSHCLTSYTLKQSGLKDFSGPFDWIFSNVRMVIHCLSDDFSTFLNRRWHESVPAELRVAEGANLSEHVYYRDKFGVKFVFNHFDITEESHYQYYVRCVERFRAAINGRDPCLLLCITQEVSVGDFEALCALFTQKDCVSVLCVRATPDCPHVFGMTLSAERGRHKLYDLRMKGDLGPLAFTDPADSLLFASLLTCAASAIGP